MAVVAEQLFKIAAMVLLGFALKKLRVINSEMQSGLSSLLLTCVLPIDIIAAGNQPLDPSLSRGMLITAVVSILYYAVTLGGLKLLVGKLPLQDTQRNLFVVLVSFGNIGFIGLPLMKGLYGTEGYMYTVVANFVFQIVLSTLGVKLMDRGGRINVKGLLLSPLVLAPVVSVAVYLSGWRMPAVAADVLDQVGGMMVPLSMIIIGGSLADIELSSILREKWGYVVGALRLVVIPLVMLLVMRLLGIGGVVGATNVVLSGLCSATLCVIFAQQYKQDVAFATRVVMQTMVLMVPALPLLFFVVDRLLPA